MTVGIPRAFLYHRYKALWETFFETLGCEVVYSRETDKKILNTGIMYAIDEACLSSKIFLGHVESLIGQCDMIFVPRIASLGYREDLCTKFFALSDIVRNTFRSRGIEVLDCNIDVRKSHSELQAFLRLGKKLGKKKPMVLYAYMMAKQAERIRHDDLLRRQDALLEKDGLKILLVGHGYNVYDKLIGQPVIDILKSMDATPIMADVVDYKTALEKSKELSETLQWAFNRELVGAVQLYRDRVDGIILLSAFPCGPDALVNEILMRRVKDIPMLTLLLDNQEGTAGIETRLESFIDIIRFRQEANDAKS